MLFSISDDSNTTIILTPEELGQGQVDTDVQPLDNQDRAAAQVEMDYNKRNRKESTSSQEKERKRARTEPTPAPVEPRVTRSKSKTAPPKDVSKLKAKKLLQKRFTKSRSSQQKSLPLTDL